MEWFEKKPLDVNSHLFEYQQYVRSQPGYLKDEECYSYLMGILSSPGFQDGKSKDGKETRLLKPVFEPWNAGEQVYFFPFLDKYWVRAGRIWVEKQKVKETRLMTFKLQLAECLREAERQDELYRLIDRSKRPDLRNWLRLGGTI